MTVCTKFMQNFISFDKKIDDIVDGLNKLYITITVEELKKPSALCQTLK